MQVVPFYDLLCSYQFTGITGARHDQEYMSTIDSGHCICIIQGNKYKIQVTICNTGQV